MNLSGLIKLFLSMVSLVSSSKNKGIIIGVVLLALVWGALVFVVISPAKGSEGSCHDFDKRITDIEKSNAVFSSQLNNINDSLSRIERSEMENRRDFNELKNVLISKGK